jgi:uncharacterized membrane protein
MKKITTKTFLKGLFAIIPVALTLYLLVWLASAAELVLGNIFKVFFPDDWYFRGLGFLMGIAVVLLAGVFLESQTFRRFFNKFEELFLQIPVIKTVYGFFKDFLMLFSSEQKGKFKQVVLVRYPSTQQQLGFITISDFNELSYDFFSKKDIAVFIPFSYQMGGSLIIVPRESVVKIDMTVEDALKFIATAGVVGSTKDVAVEEIKKLP